jgi:DNA polymerase-3 subunit beta
MKLTVQKNNLLKALQKVASIISTKSTLPVLSNVFLEAKENSLTLISSDLEVRVETTIPATVEETGITTLDAKLLLSMVAKFIGDEVLLSCDTTHHATIKCGNANFQLLGMSHEEFPIPEQFPVIRTLEFPQTEFSQIIDQISYSASTDDPRKVLLGILLSMTENTFTAVATDGKRLALVEKFIEKLDGELGDSVIPLRSLTELKRMLDDSSGKLRINIGTKEVKFDLGDTQLTTKLIEGTYPNFRPVIPTSLSKSVEIPVKRFLASLNLVSIALIPDNQFVKIRFENNKLYFTVINSAIGQCEDYMDIEYDGEPVEISFNYKFLLEPFKHAASDVVILKMNDGKSQVTLETEGFIYVIMPMHNKKK